MTNLEEKTIANISKTTSLIGNSDAKVDIKGRAFVPATFRRQLNDEKIFILRKGLFNNCLVLFPEESWNNIIAVLREKLSRWNKKEDQIFRQFVSDADKIELEDNGRMLIPKRLINAIDIHQKIRFVGCDSTIEIWPNDEIENSYIAPEEFAAEIEQLMKIKQPAKD